MPVEEVLVGVRGEDPQDDVGEEQVDKGGDYEVPEEVPHSEETFNLT